MVATSHVLCAAWPKSKDAGQKITTARNYGGAFFTLNCSYKSMQES